MANETDHSGDVSYRDHHHSRVGTQVTQAAEASGNATRLSGRASASTSMLPVPPIRPVSINSPPVHVRPTKLARVTGRVAETRPPAESSPTNYVPVAQRNRRRSATPKNPMVETQPPPIHSRTRAMVKEVKANAGSMLCHPTAPPKNFVPAPPKVSVVKRAIIFIDPSTTRPPCPPSKPRRPPIECTTRLQHQLRKEYIEREHEKTKDFIPISVRYQPYPTPEPMSSVQPTLQALHFPKPGISLAFSDGAYESNSFAQPIPGPSSEFRDKIEDITHVIRIAEFTSVKAKEEYNRKYSDQEKRCRFKTSSSWQDHDTVSDTATFNLIVPASKPAPPPLFDEKFTGARDDCGRGGRRIGDSQLLHVIDYLQLAIPDALDWEDEKFAGLSDPVHILITAPPPYPSPSRRKAWRDARRKTKSTPYSRKLSSLTQSSLRSQSANDLAAVSRLGNTIAFDRLHDAIDKLEDMYWSSIESQPQVQFACSEDS